MSNVDVRNLDHREYREVYKDELIVIPPGGTVSMGRAAAVKFLGTATSMEKDGAGRVVKPKHLRIEQDPEVHAAQRAQPYRFSAPDGKEFRTKAGHDAYIKKLENEVKEADSVKPTRRRKVATKEKPETSPEGREIGGEVESGSNEG